MVVCIPETDYRDNGLTFEKRIITRSKTKQAIFIIGSIGLYPAILAIATIAEVYLIMNLCFHKYKNWKANRKIRIIQKLPDDAIIQRKGRRIAKLDKRLLKNNKKMQKIYDQLPREILAKRDIGDYFTQQYTIACNTVKRDPNSSVARSEKKAWKQKLQMHQFQMRILLEKDYYTSASETRKIFIKRLQISKLRHRISQKIDLHYLYNLVLAQLPFGIIFLFYSQFTTREYIQKHFRLIRRYNTEVVKYKFLKTY